MLEIDKSSGAFTVSTRFKNGSDHNLNILDANLSLGSTSGLVLAVPIAQEEAASGEDIENAVQQALKEARLH